jgi:hypothetical protein
VLDTYPRLDVLVNNAGGFWAHRHITADGLEHTFALNHLAPFLLTSLLLDRLTASAPARILTVSSGAHAKGRIDFDDLQGERNYSGQRAYSQSKLANVMFTYELARRLEGTGVTATVLHPGVVRTSFGAEDQAAHLAVVIGVARLVMKTPAPRRGHTDLPRLLTRGRRHHPPVLRQPQAQGLQQRLLRHHSRRPAMAGQHRPGGHDSNHIASPARIRCSLEDQYSRRKGRRRRRPPIIRSAVALPPLLEEACLVPYRGSMISPIRGDFTGFRVQVPPRTHHDERLTCGYAMGRHSPESGTRLFLQVRTMGVQVGSRLRNDNSHRQPARRADFA